ncbi:hypothetical protein OC834_005889, partial [Tilletia horrida]
MGDVQKYCNDLTARVSRALDGSLYKAEVSKLIADHLSLFQKQSLLYEASQDTNYASNRMIAQLRAQLHQEENSYPEARRQVPELVTPSNRFGHERDGRLQIAFQEQQEKLDKALSHHVEHLRSDLQEHMRSAKDAYSKITTNVERHFSDEVTRLKRLIASLEQSHENEVERLRSAVRQAQRDCEAQKERAIHAEDQRTIHVQKAKNLEGSLEEDKAALRQQLTSERKPFTQVSFQAELADPRLIDKACRATPTEDITFTASASSACSEITSEDSRLNPQPSPYAQRTRSAHPLSAPAQRTRSAHPLSAPAQRARSAHPQAQRTRSARSLGAPSGSAHPLSADSNSVLAQRTRSAQTQPRHTPRLGAPSGSAHSLSALARRALKLTAEGRCFGRLVRKLQGDTGISDAAPPFPAADDCRRFDVVDPSASGLSFHGLTVAATASRASTTA